MFIEILFKIQFLLERKSTTPLEVCGPMGVISYSFVDGYILVPTLD